MVCEAPVNRKGFQFNKQQRLLNSAQYQQVFDHLAFKKHGQFLALFASPNQKQQHRLGLIVAKKAMPRAVQRNNFKRVTREFFRRCSRAQSNNPSGTDTANTYDVIIMAKPAAKQASNLDISSELEKQWTKLMTRR